LKANRLTVFQGRARLLGNKQIEIKTADGTVTSITAKKILLATGSRPAVIPAVPPDGKRILNSDHILNLTEPPKHLLVLGGGYIGCEFACFYAELGTKVTVVEMLDRLLPLSDADTAKEITTALKKLKVKVLTKTKLEKLEQTKDLDFSFRSKAFNGKPVMHVKELAFGYDPASPLFSDLSFSVGPYDRVCVVGKNGKGKTTLLRTLAGQLEPQAGARRE
jgi:dihydrolipoamide dehydrogenase